MPRYLISNFLGLVGAILGGVVGFYTFSWLWNHAFYGLMIPGAFLGLGCSLLARHVSTVRGVFCGLAALGLSLFTEWWFSPFKADPSFPYFLMHVKDLSPVTFLMIGVGSLIAFWVGKDAGFRGFAERRPYAQPTSKPDSRPTE
jgi:hypothetical protein